MTSWLGRMAGRRAVWGLVLVVALGLRLAFIATAPPRPAWPDARQFEALGARLAAGTPFGYESKAAPVYPYFIAGVYTLFGPSLPVLRVVEALLATATVALVGWVGMAIFSVEAGLIAAGLAALHPVMAFLPATQYSENLILFLTVPAFGAFAWAVRANAARAWVLAGAFFGVLTLAKPNAITFLPGLALGAWLELGRAQASRWKGVLCFALALAAVVLPWTVRNHRLYDHWFLVTTGGGRQFWYGNNPTATGASDDIPAPPQWMADSLRRSRSAPEREGLFYREGWRFVREHPARALRLYFVKMGALWALHPRTATHTRYSTAAADWAQGLCSIVVFSGAALGLLRLGPYGVSYFPLAVVSFTLLNSAFMMVMRYRMSFEAVLLWLAGVGYAGWLERGRRAS